MSEFVTEAQRMAQTLISERIRRGESAEDALRYVASACGVSYSALWQLRYRAPKRIFADVFFAIHARYEATRAQQQRNLEHKIAVAEAAGLDPHLARLARRVGGVDGSGE